MKKKITLATLALLMAAGLEAQNIYDAAKFNGGDLNGTARFVGMGGAMGALGGDISTISTNPAGIGIYRSNDAMVTFGYSSLGTKSKFNGVSMSGDRDRFNFDNIGFVFTNKMGDYTPLRYVNFAFNYKRSKSFYKEMAMAGEVPAWNGTVVSQTNQMVNQANWMYDAGYDIATIDENNNLFQHNNVGWLAALGWAGYLYDPIENAPGYEGVFPQPYSNFYSKESGGIDEFDFNISFNLNERVYLGASLGIYDINYKKYSSYDEDYGNGEGYTIQSWNKTDGSGFDFKIGAIVRPIESSPLRIGLAIHTPTFYTLTHKTSAHVEYDVDEDGNGVIEHDYVDTYDYLDNRDASTKYRLHTPWKFNFSLGYTVGTKLALGAEYEFQDYSSTKFRYTDGYSGAMSWENSTAKEMLKGVNTIRLGAEYKFVPEFAFRAGYNISTAAFKSDAWKDLPDNSVTTDTDYANTKAISNYTLGFGYRGKHFYADMAYKFNTYKEDFYAFYDADIDYQNYTNTLEKTKVTNKNHQLLLTLGVRF